MARVQTYSERNVLQNLSTAQGSQLGGRLGLGLLAGTAAVFLSLFGLPVFTSFF
jgi:hypothetical protein